MSLPSGWEKHVSKSTGREYYLNIHTKQSQWDPPTEASSKQVRCSHLLVKHKDSRRPSSWREDNITRTKDEALDILLGQFKLIFKIMCFSNYIHYLKDMRLILKMV